MSGVLVCLFLRFFCRSFLFIVIFLLIFEVFSADLSFFSNPIINLTYLCIFRGPGLPTWLPESYWRKRTYVPAVGTKGRKPYQPFWVTGLEVCRSGIRTSRIVEVGARISMNLAKAKVDNSHRTCPLKIGLK